MQTPINDKHPNHRLTAYLFDNLSPAGRTEVEQHLAECAACRAELQELRITLALTTEVLNDRVENNLVMDDHRKAELAAAMGIKRPVVLSIMRGRIGGAIWALGGVAAAAAVGAILIYPKFTIMDRLDTRGSDVTMWKQAKAAHAPRSAPTTLDSNRSDDFAARTGDALGGGGGGGWGGRRGNFGGGGNSNAPAGAISGPVAAAPGAPALAETKVQAGDKLAQAEQQLAESENRKQSADRGANLGTQPIERLQRQDPQLSSGVIALSNSDSIANLQLGQDETKSLNRNITLNTAASTPPPPPENAPPTSTAAPQIASGPVTSLRSEITKNQASDAPANYAIVGGGAAAGGKPQTGATLSMDQSAPVATVQAPSLARQELSPGEPRKELDQHGWDLSRSDNANGLKESQNALVLNQAPMDFPGPEFQIGTAGRAKGGEATGAQEFKEALQQEADGKRNFAFRGPPAPPQAPSTPAKPQAAEKPSSQLTAPGEVPLQPSERKGEIAGALIDKEKWAENFAKKDTKAPDAAAILDFKQTGNSQPRDGIAPEGVSLENLASTHDRVQAAGADVLKELPNVGTELMDNQQKLAVKNAENQQQLNANIEALNQPSGSQALPPLNEAALSQNSDRAGEINGDVMSLDGIIGRQSAAAADKPLLLPPGAHGSFQNFAYEESTNTPPVLLLHPRLESQKSKSAAANSEMGRATGAADGRVAGSTNHGNFFTEPRAALEEAKQQDSKGAAISYSDDELKNAEALFRNTSDATKLRLGSAGTSSENAGQAPGVNMSASTIEMTPGDGEKRSRLVQVVPTPQSQTRADLSTVGANGGTVSLNGNPISNSENRTGDNSIRIGGLAQLWDQRNAPNRQSALPSDQAAAKIQDEYRKVMQDIDPAIVSSEALIQYPINWDVYSGPSQRLTTATKLTDGNLPSGNFPPPITEIPVVITSPSGEVTQSAKSLFAEQNSFLHFFNGNLDAATSVGNGRALEGKGIEFSGLDPSVLYNDFGDLSKLGAPTGFLGNDAGQGMTKTPPILPGQPPNWDAITAGSVAALESSKALNELALRGYQFFHAANARLTFNAFMRHPQPVPPEALTDEGMDEDAYIAKYATRPFVDCARDRLSTFAMDVDTAAYTRVRGLLRAGQLPAPQSIRVEEFVNYFKQPYVVEGGEAFGVFAEAADSPFIEGAQADAPRLQLLKLGIKSRDPLPNERKPATLTFVIDTSGSMRRRASAQDQTDRLTLVKNALKQLVGALNPEDAISIVGFSEQAEMILPRTQARQKQRVLDAIDSMQATGSTNVEAGLLLGLRVADEAFALDSINRMILISDGLGGLAGSSTVSAGGAPSVEDLLNTVRTFARRGIDLSTMGVGMGKSDDELLRKFADSGNGMCHFADTAAEARKILLEKLPPHLDVLARDAKVQVEFNPAVVSRYRLLGYEKRKLADADFRNDKVDAGEVAHSTLVTALYEIVRSPGAHGSLGKVFLRWKDAGYAHQPVVERNFPLSEGIEVGNAAKASPDFRFIAAVARFAELLRGSKWTRQGSYSEVLTLLKSLPASFKTKPEWAEVLDLVTRARDLSVAQWQSSLK